MLPHYDIEQLYIWGTENLNIYKTTAKQKQIFLPHQTNPADINSGNTSPTT
jgi:hypothetical protein